MKRKYAQNSWIVLLLHSPGANNRKNEPIIGSVRLMKGIFLMCQEVRIADLKPYKFEPYLYGPTSFEVYRQVDVLKMRGIIREQKTLGSRWGIYKLTYRGEKRAERIWKEIPEITREKIRKIKIEVSKPAFLSMLNYVYTKYPKFAKKTVLKGLRKAR